MIQPIFSGLIAGVSHAEPDLDQVNAGDEVNLIKEPHNAFDPNAILITHLIAGKLGYIPKEATYCLHVAWFNGLTPKAHVSGINPEGRYPKIGLVVTVEI